MLQGAYPQTITHWVAAALDDFGNRAYATPVTLKGRWEDRSDMTTKFASETIPSKATVFLEDTDIELGDFLALGDQTATADPTSLSGAHIVKTFSKIPNIRATEFLRIATLERNLLGR